MKYTKTLPFPVYDNDWKIGICDSGEVGNWTAAK